jgi:hypothetical protein
VVGLAVALIGYGASLLPPIYEQTSFWTSSPTFFLVRLGVVLCSLPLAHFVCRAATPSRLADLGRSSLLVYWVHVELAYGVVSTPIHRGLSVEMALVGVLLLSLLMYALVQAPSRARGYWLTSRLAQTAVGRGMAGTAT